VIDDPVGNRPRGFIRQQTCSPSQQILQLVFRCPNESSGHLLKVNDKTPVFPRIPRIGLNAKLLRLRRNGDML
jgi:hypothetical protein